MKNVMKLWTKAVVFVLLFALCVCSPAEAAPLKALIVTGQSGQYHNWKVSSPILQRLLEQTGLFEVDVATSPDHGSDMASFKPNFADYDVAVIDYDGDSWPEQTKTAFVEYVKSGGGVVVYHATDNTFPKWAEFNEIIGLGGWGDRDERWGPMVRFHDGKVVFDDTPGKAGSHPPKHDFQVIIRDKGHPITADLPEKWMHALDELYGQLRGPAKNLTVLATAYSDPARKSGTGEHEPILFTVNYGKGKVFHTVLGHVGPKDSPPITAMDCVSFIVTFQRGAEWAATGNVTQKVPEDFPTATEVRIWKGCKQSSLNELLDEIATYDFGQSRESLTELTNIIRESYDSDQQRKDVEKSLLEFLQSDATLAGKQFICRQLSIIGTEEAVPTLAAMLTDPSTSDMALYALERIPGTRVDETLRKVLPKATGKAKVGIINTLGERGDKAAVKELGNLLSVSDQECAIAAAAALGKIGGKEAAAELRKELEKASGKQWAVLADAYLMCADKFLAEGDRKSALDIYKHLYTSSETAPIRSAALRGIVTATQDEAVGIIVDVLKGDDRTMQATAIGLVRQMPETEATEAVAAELPNLPVAGQVQLLSALADRGDPTALPAVVTATKAGDESVRIAALRALGELGDTSSVALLAQAAATAKGIEQETARQSLYRLRGSDVDRTIARSISRADPKVKVELIRSAGERNIRKAVKTLLKTAREPDSNVRLESIKALRNVASPKRVSAMVNILINAESEVELKEAEKTVVSVARKSIGENAGTTAVLNVIDSIEDINIRCSLLRVLGDIGNSKALGTLRAALDDNNAEVQTTAIRALSEWPNAEPTADLLKAASSTDDKTQRALALRGSVRLLSLDSDRPAEETMKMYKQTMSLASSVSEKKMVLSGLANIKGIESLETAVMYLEDKALQQEAEVAVVKIAESTISSHPHKTKAVLHRLLQISKNDYLREQAQKIIEQIE